MKVTALDVAREVAREAHCLACDKRPDRVRQGFDLASRDATVAFFCHGAMETVTLTERELVHRDLRPFVARVRGLFANHKHPDVKELIRYNRGGWAT